MPAFSAEGLPRQVCGVLLFARHPVPRRSVSASLIVALALAVSSAGRAQDQREREFQECPDCPKMVGIPGGTFLMGSPPKENGRFDSEGPQHSVALKAFALGKYPVTSDDFLAFLKATGYRPLPCNKMLNMGWQSPGHGKAYSPYNGDQPRWPAICLGWDDAEAYIAWLNAKVRLARPAMAARPTGPYRLPTEAEWEYAARAGTTTARWWGDALGRARANCNGCGSEWDNRLLASVDSFAANPFGLYGMLGNAWEWTADCWHPNYKGAPEGGSAWEEKGCRKHVIRGGSWHNLPVFVRSAARSGSEPGDEQSDYSSLTGFRVARDLP
jgi:formylglycine-generating enzyme required for sulfatase activity